jgi:hypothetical protein
MVRKPIRPMSPMKKSQLRKPDHEKMRWKSMMAVNTRDDCQAWNLSSSC